MCGRYRQFFFSFFFLLTLATVPYFIVSFLFGDFCFFLLFFFFFFFELAGWLSTLSGCMLVSTRPQYRGYRKKGDTVQVQEQVR